MGFWQAATWGRFIDLHFSKKKDNFRKVSFWFWEECSSNTLLVSYYSAGQKFRTFKSEFFSSLPGGEGSPPQTDGSPIPVKNDSSLNVRNF